MMNGGLMRCVAVFASFAVAVCVGGCATPASSGAAASQPAPSEASSQPAPSEASSQPASSQPASSEPAPSAPAPSAPASSAPASSSATAAPAAGISLSPAVEARLWAFAVSAATAEGSTVRAAQAVGSTHARAVAVTMGDGVEGDQAVWVVQIEGVTEFVCDQCSVPPGARAPHGRFQLQILDASTFRTLDFGLESTKTDLTKLGPVVDLHP
jgi:hypothetical protein